MGMITVSENEKGFDFDGESSKEFDLFITGGAIFDAPERDVEMIEIPGRNGAFVHDLGRFQNVTVTYKCALSSTEEQEFVDAMRKVRQWLCSKRGYCKLSDDFNPGEYRMAMFKGYIEVTNEAPVVGRFDLSFDCMPQRFLTDGEQAVQVTSGQPITNPTMFDAKPLLQVWGYGDISINGETISIDDDIIGEVGLVAADGSTSKRNGTKTFSEDVVNAGDDITLAESTVEANALLLVNVSSIELNGNPVVASGGSYVNSARSYIGYTSGSPYPRVVIEIVINATQFDAGTAATYTARIEQAATISGNAVQIAADLSVAYSSGRIAVSCTTSIPATYGQGAESFFKLGAITAYSTKSALGEPLYFDMDIGEAYKEEGGEIVSVNNAVSFPVELPVLIPGANAITFDNTVQTLKVVPRWWEV